ncbi:Phage terminase-like protein, large subunit, contains N-terminal HTH domain [Peptoclostridium litorale DSM 5388]|uniref:Putative terminase large subunit n=1 Tax=Peptoclostridium litorale DSM 5388 TaxID=1121324 RepID=A0A069RFW2_PEPLI|nr:terminase TerL endonuclease subunit [Peptoclostridium litorale]KDR95911.1 putative terminase large subunit [Peptoclostridium litorale DSM 5388]SIO10149.1 Phage terminase-like protein, large subunit, contains N-terminal HTH domain [Peptoclostridium litorale DSM 5388]
MDRVTKYAREVLAGNIVAGYLVILACNRHIEDLKKSKKKSYKYCYDEEAADRAIDFFGFLNHTKGEWAGTPVELELWQCFVIGSIFGWKHKDTDLRRYRTAYEQVARKNGKSTKLAGVGLYGLTGDGEQGAEVYSAATKRDQSKIIFDEAKRMVKASKHLSKYIDTFTNNMNVPVNNSKFEPLSSDANTMDGLNVHFGLIDELHAHKTREVYDVLETATGARSQPLIYIITTAGFNRNGICYEMYEYSVKILEGTVEDDTFFAYIAQIDEGDDWTDPECWIKANPNLGVSCNVEDLQRKCEKAKEIPAAQNNFLCKHLNIWVNSQKRWMNMFKWAECPQKIVTEKELIEYPCIVGMDLSSTTDITSVNFEFDMEDYFYILSHSFMPEEGIEEKERRDNVPYTAWAREGYITLTPGPVVDYDWIELYIFEKAKVFDIMEICYDPWNATQIANDFKNEGFTTVEVRQGYKTLSEPMKNVYDLVLQQKLIHNGNPLLTWTMSNVVATQDPAGNIKPDKSKAQYRIDPAVALITSHSRAMLKPYKGRKSVYEERGLFFI